MVGSGDYMLASEYPYYIYANEKDADTEKGVYVVLSEDEGTKTATYEISEADGERILLFHSSEGDIKYFYDGGVVPGKAAISKAKAKSNNTRAVLRNCFFLCKIYYAVSTCYLRYREKSQM